MYWCAHYTFNQILIGEDCFFLDYWPSRKVSPYARGAKLKAALFPSLSPSLNWLYSGMQTPKTIKHNWKLMKYSFVLVLAMLLHGSNSTYISRKKIWVSFCKLRADIRCPKTSWHSSSIVENSTYSTFCWWHHHSEMWHFLLTKEKLYFAHNLANHFWKLCLGLICSKFPDEHIHAISIYRLNLVTTKMHNNKRSLHP